MYVSLSVRVWYFYVVLEADSSWTGALKSVMVRPRTAAGMTTLCRTSSVIRARCYAQVVRGEAKSLQDPADKRTKVMAEERLFGGNEEHYSCARGEPRKSPRSCLQLYLLALLSVTFGCGWTHSPSSLISFTEAYRSFSSFNIVS